MDFYEAEQKMVQFSTQLQSGQITTAQFAGAMTVLRVTDAGGTIWQPSPSGDGWIFWTGSSWQPGIPVHQRVPIPDSSFIPPAPPATSGSKTAPDAERSQGFNEFKSSLMTVDEFKKISKDVPLAKRPQKWWDLLSILGGVAGAVLWLIYGGIRSSREGFDLITPLLMIAIPVILVWFRADIDQLLQPLQPYRKKISKIILIGLGIATPFLTAWVLYNIFQISQYPLMQVNIVVGTLVAYAVTRDPKPAGVQPKHGTAMGNVLVIFTILLCSCIMVPVVADDCSSDPLNAQDCLRTDGYAEIMAGLVAAILSALINGPIIIQTLLQGGAEGGAGAGEPLSPPETPIPDPPGEDTQKDGMAILRKQKQDWEAAEAAKKAAENKKLLENLQHMQRQIVSGPHGDLYRPGEAGDLNKQINTAINQTIFGKDVNKDLYNQIYQIYKGRNLSVGRTIPESQMISDSGIRRDTIVGTLEPTGNEIFTGRDANGNFSSKSLALRFLAGIGTLGSSELVATPVSSLYTMKSYVDGGGSSVLGGFSEAMKDVAIGEGIGLGISGLSAVGGKIVGALANELPTSISGPIKDGIEDLKNVLNTDVKDLFTTKTSGGLAGTNPHVKTSAEITEQFLKGKELGEISPGLKDYAIVPGIDPPDLSCFSDNARKAIRLAADRSLADIHFKASNPDSGIKLANGEAIPKWSEIKVTTVKEGDLPLGYSEDHKGLVVYKQPETPVKTAGMSEGEWQAANKQYDYKLKEFNDQGPAIAELQAQGKINVDPDTGLITSTKHNKPFASDNDAYCYTKPGTHETVSKFVEAKINQDLQGFGVIEHPNHTAWNYSNASNSAMNKLVPIDSKALTGSKLGVEGAIPLNTYRPLEGTWGTSWYNGPTVRSWVQGMLQQ